MNRPSFTVHAAAPARLDFAGGWTDVPPFSAVEGGVVVNAAISLQAHASVTLGGTGVHLHSEDLGITRDVSGPDELAGRGPLALLEAALRMLPVHPCTLVTRSDAPPGSGLGSSGAMDVALVAALVRAREESLEPEEIAEQAWRLEAVEAGLPGGRQDQFAAALGGFHRLTFRDPDVGVERLVLDAEFVEELERRTVLCYTGSSRISGDTIARVMAGYQRRDRGITGALQGMREVADEMAEALRNADLPGVGRLLSRNWALQQDLDAGMRTPEMQTIESAVAQVGVFGGKAAGAGAGGSMFFVAQRDPAEVVEAATAAGARVLPMTFSSEGVRTW